LFPGAFEWPVGVAAAGRMWPASRLLPSR
jgi:hypothetical protein